MTPREFADLWINDADERETIIHMEKDRLDELVGETISLTFRQLNETAIREVFTRSGMSEADINALFDDLKKAGFHAPTVQDIIYGKLLGCGEPTEVQEADERAQFTATGGAVYGQGQIHLRGIYPNRTNRGKRVIELRGQGFCPNIEVRFAHENGQLAPIPGVIIRRRADVDVHQYLYVEGDFQVTGNYWVEMHNMETGDWVTFACKLEIVR